MGLQLQLKAVPDPFLFASVMDTVPNATISNCLTHSKELVLKVAALKSAICTNELFNLYIAIFTRTCQNCKSIVSNNHAKKCSSCQTLLPPGRKRQRAEERKKKYDQISRQACASKHVDYLSAEVAVILNIALHFKS